MKELCIVVIQVQFLKVYWTLKMDFIEEHVHITWKYLAASKETCLDFKKQILGPYLQRDKEIFPDIYQFFFFFQL